MDAEKFPASNATDSPEAGALSGHVIFQLLFRPTLHSFLEHFPFHFTNISLMTLRSHHLRTKRVYCEEC